MPRRLAPGALLVAFSFMACAASAAEDTPGLDELVQQAVARQLGVHATADDTYVPMSQALSGPIDPATYRLGPGDQLYVRWTGRLSRSDRVDVGPAGDVFLTEIGTLDVADMTLAAARLAILERLQRVTRDVRVEVQLARPRRFHVYRSGSVAEAGPVEALGGSRLSDILRPEGLLPGASHRNVRVLRRDGTQELADLERVFRLGDHSRDPWLRDGDEIVVPWAIERVRVAGAVPEPGLIEHRFDDSLGTVLRLAGGMRAETAPEAAQWIHWTSAAAPETLTFDLRDALEGRFDRALAHGDAVFVRARPGYRETGEVLVEGDVARPGGYPVSSSGTHLSEILAAAGGLLPSADSTGILLRRHATGPAPDEAELERRSQAVQRELTLSEFEVKRAQWASRNEIVRVDWSRDARSPRTADALLRDGDVVTIPRLVRSLRVEGQVTRPGLVMYAPGLSVSDYIRQAGGTTALAWHGHAQVTRSGSSHTVLARSAGEPHPGDFIWVPMRPQESQWSRIGAVLGGLAQIATIVIAIRSVR